MQQSYFGFLAREQKLCAAIGSGRVPEVVDGGMLCCGEPKLPDGGINGGLSAYTLRVIPLQIFI
jgi:hypothetical protein